MTWLLTQIKPLRVLLLSFIGIGVVGIVQAQDGFSIAEAFDAISAEQGATIAIIIILLGLAILTFLQLGRKASDRKSVEISLVERLIESNKESTDKSIENLEKSRDELQKEVTTLKKEVTELKQEKATHDKVVAEKDTVIKERDSTISDLQAEITTLKAENKKTAQLKLDLSNEQTRYHELRKEFDSQKKQWNETFQAMMRREKAIQSNDTDTLDKTIPLPDEKDIEDLVNNSADDGTDNDSDKKDNAA